jgi:uncharacterized protein YjbI with pentapeptide repeats
VKGVRREWLAQVLTQLPVFLTALAALAALYFNNKGTRESLQATRDQLALSEQGQITDRFSKAVAQLGTKDSIEVRLGGIYALERIARDSMRDHPTVMEVLSAFVREHSPLGTCVTGPTTVPTTDVQAALTVLGRHDQTRDRDPLNLESSCLAGANLIEANLTRAQLTGADLTKANLSGANLTYASLTRANLINADLAWANLTYASLTEANLTGAFFYRANLTRAFLSGANLTRAQLTRADLTDASLTGANLTDADLTEANLTGAEASPNTTTSPPGTPPTR